MHRPRSRIASGLMALAALACGSWGLTILNGCGLADSSKKTPTQSESAKPSDQTQVRPKVGALGYFDPQGGIVRVGAIPGQRVEILDAMEQQSLKKGDRIAQLDGYMAQAAEIEQLKLQRDMEPQRHEAEVKHAEALLQEALAAKDAQVGPHRLELTTHQEKLRLLQQKHAFAEKGQRRLTGVREGLIPVQAVDEADLAVQAAAQELAATHAAIAQLETTIASLEKAADAKVRSARANLDRVKTLGSKELLDKQVEVAELRLKSLEVFSPINGQVLRVTTREGEMTGPSPIVEMADLSVMYVIAEVDQTDVAQVKVDAEVDVIMRGLAQPQLSGTVKRISNIVAAASQRSLNPAEPVDRRVREVWIKLDEKSSSRAADYVGMQVEVKIHVGAKNEPENNVRGDDAATGS